MCIKVFLAASILCPLGILIWRWSFVPMAYIDWIFVSCFCLISFGCFFFWIGHTFYEEQLNMTTIETLIVLIQQNIFFTHLNGKKTHYICIISCSFLHFLSLFLNLFFLWRPLLRCGNRITPNRVFVYSNFFFIFVNWPLLISFIYIYSSGLWLSERESTEQKNYPIMV